MNCVKRLLPVLLVAASLAACTPPAAKKGSSSPSASRTQPRTAADRSRAAPGAKTPSKPTAGAPRSTAPAVADLKTRYNAALEQIRKGQLADAEESLEQIVKEAPDLSGPKTNLGIIYAKTNRRNDALSAFNKAAAANPRNIVAHNWLGTLYRESREYALAEAAYLKALAIDDDYPPTLLNLAILYDEHLQQPARALDYYKKYKRKADDAEMLKLNVWISALEEKLAPPKKS